MKPQFSLFFAIMGLLSASAAQAQVFRVPSPVDEGAVFSEDQLVAEGPDGARAVIGGAALITAVSGSKIVEVEQPDATSLRIALGDGGFIVQVGSRPVAFEIGGANVEASGALLTVSDNLVRVDRLFDGGKVEAKRMVPAPEPEPVPAEEPPQAKKPGKKGSKKVEEPPPPQRLQPPPMEPRISALEAGKTYRMAVDSDPALASADESSRVDDVSSRLVDKPKPIVLKPVAVEDPADLAGAAAKGDEAVELAEIEPVEVEIEADCVEICTD
jgi:hypothetical protein